MEKTFVVVLVFGVIVMFGGCTDAEEEVIPQVSRSKEDSTQGVVQEPGRAHETQLEKIDPQREVVSKGESKPSADIKEEEAETPEEVPSVRDNSKEDVAPENSSQAPDKMDEESVPECVRLAIEAFGEIKKGDEAFQKGDSDAAIAHYEKALALTPNAPKFRFTYAQLLYQKGIRLSKESHRLFQRSLGNVFDGKTGQWVKGAELSVEAKQGLAKESADLQHQSLACFNNSLRELIRCDVDWNYAVKEVPFAMGMVYVFLEDYDNAVKCYERVLANPKVSEDYKIKVREAIEAIEQQKKEAEKEK